MSSVAEERFRGEYAADHGTRRRPYKSNILFSVLVLEVLMVLSYNSFIAPTFGYIGLGPLVPRISWFALVTFATVPALTFDSAVRRPSDFVMLIVYLVGILPAAVFGAGRVNSIGVEGAYRFTILVIPVFTVANLVRQRLRPFHLKANARFDQNLVLLILIANSLVAVGLVVTTFGLNIDSSIFNDIYDTRLASRDRFADGFPLAPYVIRWQANVINPALVVYSFQTRQRLWLLVATLLQVVMFTTTAQKSMLFAIPAVATAYYVCSRRDGARRLVKFVGLAVVSSAVFDWLLGGFYASSLITRRVLAVPGFLAGVYVDYYEQHQGAPYWWRHSILGALGGSAPGGPPAGEIGQFLTGSSDLSANAGIFADGFANGRTLGVLLVAAVLVALCVAVDSAAAPVRLSTSAGLLVMPSFALANGSFVTVLGTHGMLLALVLLAIWPNDAGSAVIHTQLVDQAP